MADDIKRLHYFDHQFMRAGDFTAEQEYHLRMRRRHLRLQHTWGIATGLQLSFATGASRATVGQGAAVDVQGREIVLTVNTQTTDLSSYSGKTVYVTIAYDEQQTDPTSETGVTGNTRWSEVPLVDVTPDDPDDPSTTLVLGRVDVGADGRINGIDDGSGAYRRRDAGVVAGDLEVRSLALSAPEVASSEWARLRLGAADRADLQGNLNVSGDIETAGEVDGRDVAADGAALDQHVARTDNPHGTTAAQVGAPTSVNGVHNPGGDVSLAGRDAVTITPNDAANQITIGESHSARTDNPHATTAAQVGALPLSGGDVTGGLSVGAGSVQFGTASAGDSNTMLGSPPQKKITLTVLGGTSGSVIGTSGKIAVLIWPFLDGMVGLKVGASPGGVDTTVLNGTTRFSGNKIGYVTDTFVNASGGVLHTGDVVKLHPAGTVRFHGDNNLIPIPQVTLSDTEDDPLVIGIVCQEATPAPGEPDGRTEPDDPTAVPDGGDVFVVTLGAFAHCHVDASSSPIAVGDLLTTSATAGHACKAISPRVGAVIGKALEPCAAGTAHIAVFVNIQ
ncbi:hypothetical protein ADK86_03235 [Streptomyces sp. NRRL F-5755]|uniref:hypothetical protein n=1 Tax=Streptomyces sp. NRRL F-5755 TaxID=1519475 RepID=UPI0006AFDF41|nr:hypothetical protein [Streptomyces sp. NRRL F-5755]KOU08788.1 hypothetical protein ADK86_03235 [Streptomyces sp. NRRL F-5755]